MKGSKWRFLWVALFLILLLIGLFFPQRFVSHSENDKEDTGIVVYDRRVPIWSEFDLGRHGWPNAYTFFFGGKDVLVMQVDRNRRITGSALTFYDESGNEKVVYGDHTGSGEITDRIVYSGGRSYEEILLPGSWKKLEKRGPLSGVMIDGQWRAVQYTNGTWSIQNEGANQRPIE